jgi:hypothetical protein
MEWVRTCWQSPGAGDRRVEPEPGEQGIGGCRGRGEHGQPRLVLDGLDRRKRGHLHAGGKHEGVGVREVEPVPVLAEVGASVRRREDPRLLSGRARFVDDIHLPRMLHAQFVRGPPSPRARSPA